MPMIPVEPGYVATIVTDLEMRERPPIKPVPDGTLQLVRWRRAEPDTYRALFRRVGMPWLWFSRLILQDDVLTAIIHDDAVELYAVVDSRGLEVGMLELDFRQHADCEIAYFGLIPELTGGGHGRWLMARTMALAWREGIDRVWVHTCTLDHPSALNFYRAQGFVAIKREVETFADPRLTGALPEDAAPQIPLLRRR